MSGARRAAAGTALVTGASGGIGAELARLLAADGYDLVLVARSIGKLQTLAAERSSPHRVRCDALAADLSVPGAAAALANGLVARGLVIDVLVNNAGVGLGGAFVETDASAEAAMLQLDVVALTELTKLLLPPMRARGRGRVLNLASTAAFQAGPNMAVYSASKAYVLSFSGALAEELAGTGVTVTCLAPGATRTGFESTAHVGGALLFRLPTVMSATDVARAGYEGLMRGRRLVVPGLANKLAVQATRLAPRRLAARISGALTRR